MTETTILTIIWLSAGLLAVAFILWVIAHAIRYWGGPLLLLALLAGAWMWAQDAGVDWQAETWGMGRQEYRQWQERGQ